MKGRIWLTLVVLGAGYLLFSLLLRNDELIVAFRVLQAAVCAAVVYIYGPDAWRAVRDPNPTGTDYLIAGIFLSFLATFCQAVYSVGYRLAGAPKWLLASEITAPFVLISVIAAVLHVSAPGAVNGQVPKRNRIAIGAALGVSVAIVMTIVVTQPDLTVFTIKVRPFGEE